MPLALGYTWTWQEYYGNGCTETLETTSERDGDTWYMTFCLLMPSCLTKDGNFYMEVAEPPKWILTATVGETWWWLEEKWEMEDRNATVIGPAGTFTGCLQIYGQPTFTLPWRRVWLAPNVGLVQQDDGGGFRYELTSYSLVSVDQSNTWSGLKALFDIQGEKDLP